MRLFGEIHSFCAWLFKLAIDTVNMVLVARQFHVCEWNDEQHILEFNLQLHTYISVCANASLYYVHACIHAGVWL